MTMRYAHSQLQPEQIKKLQSELGPLVALPTIEAFFGHWPEDLKAKIFADFYQKLNQAELDYSTCKELISKDNPITGDALFSKLARNVLELSGHSPTDIVEFMLPYSLAIEAWKNMKLDKHIEAIAKIL